MVEDEADLAAEHHLGNSEWRQLLAEAESLLVPLPEVRFMRGLKAV